jgi:branched-chain amino acid transport system permease protein
MKNRPYQEIFTLIAIAVIGVASITRGGYIQWLTGYVLLYLIQGYVAWFLFSKCNQPFYGYAFTMAIGAYSTIVPTVIYGWPIWGGILLGGVLSSVAASVLYIATSRARGFYVGMVSFLLTILFPSVVEAMRNVTGGRSGMSFGGLSRIIGNTMTLWLLLGVAILVAGFFFWLLRTKTGKIFVSIAENDQLARSIGLNTFRYKLLAFAIAGLISGIGGGLYIGFVRSISSIDLNVTQTLYITFIPIIGGTRVPFGPLLGTLFIRLVPETLSSIERYLDMIFGATFVVVVIGLPGGIGNFLHSSVERLFHMITKRFASLRSVDTST